MPTKASKEEIEKEQDVPPGPGGLLFGTLFKYMEEKHEEELGTENQNGELLEAGETGKDERKEELQNTDRDNF